MPLRIASLSIVLALLAGSLVAGPLAARPRTQDGPTATATATAPAPARAGSLPPRKREAIDRAIRAEMARQKAVGVAIGVIRDGRVVYLQGYGFADLESRIPVDESTLFRWASAGKPLTALAALQLWEQGKLDLDADVREYVPEFPDKGVKITPRQLMGHLGGIVHYSHVTRTERNYDVEHPYEDVILALDTFKDSKLLNQPGTTYAYSTHGYILLSAVVQRAGERMFAEQVRERIIEPLGLRTLQPDYQWVEIPNRAVGYTRRGDQTIRSTDTDVSWKLGGGGYLSNIGDFAEFANALIHRRLVDEETEAMMWTPQILADGRPTTYGLGFAVATDRRGRLRVGHTGSQEKTRTLLQIYPRQGQGVVIMTNSEQAEPEGFAAAISRALRPQDEHADPEPVR